MFFGNKLLRKEGKIINDTRKHVSKSKKCLRKIIGNKEIYYLDNCYISFDTTKSLLVVGALDRKTIYSMNCAFSQDRAQQVRFHRFSELLDVARRVYEDLEKSKSKNDKMQKAQEKVIKKAKEQQEQVQLAEKVCRWFRSL